MYDKIVAELTQRMEDCVTAGDTAKAIVDAIDAMLYGDDSSNDQYLRNTALELAVKAVGSVADETMIVRHAKAYLAFLKGETKPEVEPHDADGIH